MDINLITQLHNFFLLLRVDGKIHDFNLLVLQWNKFQF